MQGEPTRELLGMLPVAILVISEPGVVKWMNARAERLLGLPRDKVIDCLVFDIVHPEDRKQAAHRLGALLNAEQLNSVHYRVLRDNGTVVRLLVESVAVELDGEPYLITLLRDADD